VSVGLAGMSRGEAWRQRSWRHVTVAISIALHVAAVLVAIAYSFWHVEELSPPSVTVTFVSAAAAPPPPPPPPPPLGGQGSPAKRRPVSRPKTEAVPVRTTPAESPHPQPETPAKVPVADVPKTPTTPNTAPEGAREGTAPGVKGGVAGGVAAGVAGGVVGGAIGAPPRVAPKFLPPQMGAQLKLSGAEPDFPAVLRRPGASFVVVAKICVGVAGGVDTVTVQKRADPSLDNNVVTAVKGWRFRPATANGAPVPFCYFGRFEFKSD